MSSRGGRGGRGRGYTPPTGAALYLKRSAQECGLDDRNLRTLQDITTPALFPDILWHSNGTLWNNSSSNSNSNNNNNDVEGDGLPPPTKRSSSTLYLIRKGREIHSRMQAQVREKHEQDVLRYRKQQARPKESLGAAYIPHELLQPSPKIKSLGVLGRKKNATLTIQELEELEKKRLKTVEQDETEDNIEREEESEEEDVADYTMNYYESEGEESDGGGDGEPTF